MPVINRFSQPIRSATFQPFSLQELSLAPQLQMQREEKALQQADVLSAIDVPRLVQDEPVVTERLSDLRGRIGEITDRLAQEGYSKDLSSQLRKLRTDYARETGPSGVLGRAQLNYSQAQEQLKNLEQDLRRRGAPQEIIDLNKRQFLQGYQGVSDPEGVLQEFRPGRTAGFFDVQKEAGDLFRQAQATGELIGVDPNDVSVSVTSVAGQPILKIVNRRTGQKITNAPQLEAGINYLFNEYTNPATQRGFFAQQSGMSPEYLGRTFRDLSKIFTSERFSQIPGQTTTFKTLPEHYFDTETKAPDLTSHVDTIAIDAGAVDEQNEYWRPVLDSIVKEQAATFGLEDVVTYEELKKVSEMKGDVMRKVQTAYPGTPLFRELSPEAAERKRAANDLLESIKTSVGEKGAFAVNLYNIDALAAGSKKEALEIEGIKKNLNTELNKSIIKLKGISKESAKNLEDIKGDIELVGYGFSPGGGLTLKIAGQDKDDEPLFSTVNLENPLTIRRVLEYLRNFDPDLTKNYLQARRLSTTN